MAFDPNTARPLEFDPSTAKPAEFDPNSATLTEFNPGTAVEAAKPAGRRPDRPERPISMGVSDSGFTDPSGKFHDALNPELPAEPDTSFNALKGAGERVGDLFGNLIKGGGMLIEEAGRKVAFAGRVQNALMNRDADKAGEPTLLEKPILDATQAVADPLKSTGKALTRMDFNYVPTHTWEKVKKEFGEGGPMSGSAWGEVAKYAGEQGVKSIPDMVAAVYSLPAYITSRSVEMGDERAKNNGKTEADLSDALEALPFAVGSAILERIGAKGMTTDVVENVGKEALKQGLAKTATKEGFKASGKEGGTEFVQEGVLEYVGEKYGTDAKMSVAEAFDRGLGGAVAGGVSGGAVGATTAAGAKLLEEQPISDSVAPETSSPAPEVQAEPESAGPTLEDIAQADGAELDAMVDEYLSEELPVPDIEAFNEEVASGNQPSNEAAKPEVAAPATATAAETDRRAAARPDADRRADPKRAVFDSLPPEQRDILLRSDVIPSLPSKRAFEFHMEDNPDNRVMFFDFDDFKAVNDRLGEKETDRAILEPSGELINEVLEKFPDIKGFHRSGDEFMATGTTDERLEEFATALRERLKNAKLEAILPDGTTDKIDIEFSYGIDQNEETSRAASKRQKAERKAAGLRSGDRDKVLDGQAPAGDQIPAGQVAFDPTTARPVDEQQKAPAPAETEVLAPSTAQNVPRGTSQTDNPAFKKWFGESRVVNSEGKPLVVYHGTAEQGLAGNAFDKSLLGSVTKSRSAKAGFFFVGNKDVAKGYSRLANEKPVADLIAQSEKAERQGKWDLAHDLMAKAEKLEAESKPKENVVAAYLSIKNPFEFDAGEQRFLDLQDEIQEAIKEAKAGGHDGIVLRNLIDNADWGRDDATDHWIAFEPTQIKSAIGNRGTFDESDPNILHANPVTAVYKGYQRLGRATLKRVHDAFGWKMTPLGKLPAQQLYLKERYETLGKVADVEAISNRIYETFRGLDASEAEKVYEYFTTKDADLSKLSDKPVKYTWKGQKVESTVRKQAETIKRLINKVGDNLVEKGLLSKESHEKYEDAYLPRVYLKHLLGPGASRNFAGGKKPSDMGYLKERKDIPQDVRELILGEITDPGYLASKSLGKSMRDLAILDWFEEIAQNPDWVMPDSLIDYKGSKASIFWLKAEAARIKEQIPYYTPANQAKAQTIVQQMDAIVAKGESKLQKVTDDYRQAPDTPQYGRMRGMYLRKEIYNDIVGIPGNTDPNARWWEKPFEYGGIGTKATQLWKMSKVALNPPTQIRNFISNGILLQLSGVGSHRVLPLMVQAIQEMRENGKHWRIAKKYGITASTFANNELYKIERSFLDLKARNAGNLSMAQLKNMAGIVGDAAGDMYQLSEGIWKTAKIIDAMKREGMSESDAVLEAQKWMYDYSLVPQTVRYFRNTPIGVPFLTFYYKTLPRMLEVMATAPHRFAPYVAIPALFAAAIAEMYDVDPEDVEKLKLALPEWLRDHGHLFFLPFKDKHGRWQAFDFSYLLPWSMFEQLKNNVVDGNVREAIGSAGILGGPVIDLASAIKTGVDPFTKKEIADKSDPPAKQVMSWMNYLWSMGAPTWLTDNGFMGKMREAITNEVDKQGDPKLTVGQAALRFMGLNVYPIEPEASRRKNMSFMQFEIAEMEKRMNERLRDKNLTMDDKKDIRRVYKEMMNEKRDQLKDYREKSKIHPNLKADKIPGKAEGDHDA